MIRDHGWTQCAKLGDFGVSRIVDDDDSSLDARAGTRCYMAPEVIVA